MSVIRACARAVGERELSCRWSVLFLRWLVGRDAIYLKPHAAHLRPGLECLGYLKKAGEPQHVPSAPEPPPPTTPVTGRSAPALTAEAKVAEARRILVQLKEGPWSSAPFFLDQALHVLS